MVRRLAHVGYSERVSVLITSPVVGATSARRLVALASLCDLAVVADHPSGADELAIASSIDAVPLSVLCDVDVGLGRTGALGPSEALEIVERITDSA
ncbi:MAG TPA: hypothetical protein VIJ86_11160 [Acidimicrobiales bacterium]